MNHIFIIVLINNNHSSLHSSLKIKNFNYLSINKTTIQLKLDSSSELQHQIVNTNDFTK